jgi:hypothetical protein
MSNCIGIPPAFCKITYAMQKNKISCPCGQLIYIIFVIESSTDYSSSTGFGIGWAYHI